MDKFIKNFFANFDSPGLEFLNSGGVFDIEARAQARTSFDAFPYHRSLTVKQSMTWLGKVECYVSGGPSDLDGLAKQYLTTEGSINFSSLGSDLKNQSGQQTAVWSSYMANMQRWSWRDNQVALLVNALRWTLLKKLESVSEGNGLSDILPVYDDGHVIIDRTQVFDASYPRHDGSDFSWPGGVVDAHYPAMSQFNTFSAPDESDAIDLRGFGQAEAQWMLAMLGKWERSSRYAIDFSTPMLTKSVGYRRANEVGGFGLWLAPKTEEDRVVPKPLGWVSAWSALRRYVVQNRLYSQFMVAVQVLSEVMCQFLPDSAEGQVWLAMTRDIHIPAFNAVRGRYALLTEGESAFLSHRALREWAYIGTQLERITLYSAALNQAFQTGVGIRTQRVINEENPTDVLATAHVVSSVETSYAAYCSEATKTPVPLHGMSDVYVVLSGHYDGELSEPSMMDAILPEDAEARGYSVSSASGVRQLRITYLRPAGVPLLILPLKPFPKVSPYELKFELSVPQSDKSRLGAFLSHHDAWNLAWAARFCGYDLEIDDDTKVLGANRYFASNENSWTHQLALTRKSRLGKILVTGMVPRKHVFVDLPPVHTQRFDGSFRFEIMIMDLWARSKPASKLVRIVDFGNTGGVPGAADIRINVPDGITRLRGMIKRGEQDFQFVDYAQAGVIPINEGLHSVEAVGVNMGVGGPG